MPIDLQKWFRLSLLSLFFVALVGLVLRYKIAFELPFIDQKHLLHGHSHFAFAGWVTQAIMTLMIAYLSKVEPTANFRKYKLLLILNLITAYGMLISFPIQGYAFFSILFSTLSIFVSYAFAIAFWKDLNKVIDHAVSVSWLKAALFFSVLSSIGPFSLSYMMATHQLHEKWYLASIYFFLHFQYNGWFFFACMGLLTFRLERLGISERNLRQIYRFFVFACVPAYCLSILWINIPTPLYLLVIFSSIIQLIGWAWLIKILYENKKSIAETLSPLTRTLFILAAIANTIKVLLQAGSTHPTLSQIAFGFRPIVIGYLHLVLLGATTIFLIAFSISEKIILVTRQIRLGIIIFVSGIIINEFFLMIQGMEALQNESVPLIHYYLFGTALVMFSGIGMVVVSRKNNES